MKNKMTISANEINKYMYCPYQWYYEKIYGIKELRMLKRELNEENGYTDASESNFRRGQEFHNSYYKDEMRTSRFKLLLYSACFIAGLVFGAYFYFNFFR